MSGSSAEQRAEREDILLKLEEIALRQRESLAAHEDTMVAQRFEELHHMAMEFAASHDLLCLRFR